MDLARSIFDMSLEVEPPTLALQEDIPVGGRLNLFTHNWHMFPTNLFVWDMLVQGHAIPFIGNPPLSNKRFTPLKGEYKFILAKEIEKLLQKNAIERVLNPLNSNGYYNTYFLVPKKAGNLRPVLNLRPLNRSIRGRLRTGLGKSRIVVLVNLVKLFKVGQYKKARIWLRLLGLMVSTFQVVQDERLFVRPIQIIVLVRWKHPESLEERNIGNKKSF